MLTIDLRCTWPTCTEAKRGDIYRMVGQCGNCRTEDILILITAGHEKPTSIGNPAKCPVCGCRSVSAQRLATEDEVPVGISGQEGTGVSSQSSPSGTAPPDRLASVPPESFGDEGAG